MNTDAKPNLKLPGGFVRNAIEFAVIIAIWFVLQRLIQAGVGKGLQMSLIVLAIAWAKTAFFGAENLQQLLRASNENMPYHRFMVLMLVNMLQIILSFGLDYHCMHTINPGSFSSISMQYSQPELIFEFVYFSSLNFTFFGYGDVTPQTVLAKLLTITEIMLAFVTVIFLLSDFISLEDSIRPGTREA
jgi:Ion channel